MGDWNEQDDEYGDQERGPRFPAMGRAKEWGFGKSPKKGTVRLEVVFELTGEFAGKHATYHGYLTPNTVERTFEAMRTMGWKSDSIEHIDDLNTNEVSLLIEEESYTNDQGEAKKAWKVAFVNRPFRLNIKNKVEGSELKSLASQFKGAAMASKQKMGGQKQENHQRGPATYDPQRSRAGQGGFRPGQAREPYERASRAAPGPGYNPDDNPFREPGSDDDIPF